MQNYEE